MDPAFNLAALGLLGPLDAFASASAPAPGAGERRRPRGKGFRGNVENAKTKICLR